MIRLTNNANMKNTNISLQSQVMILTGALCAIDEKYRLTNGPSIYNRSDLFDWNSAKTNLIVFRYGGYRFIRFEFIRVYDSGNSLSGVTGFHLESVTRQHGCLSLQGELHWNPTGHETLKLYFDLKMGREASRKYSFMSYGSLRSTGTASNTSNVNTTGRG